MHGKLEEAKAQLLANAAALATQRKTGPTADDSLDADVVRQLISTYYRHTVSEDLLDRSPVDLYGAVMSQLRMASTRPQGTAAVRVFTPTLDDNEWSAAGHTVVEIVTDDMPFLVDSVTMALTSDARSIHLVIHPQFAATRDLTGRLTALESTETSDGAADAVRESWMHFEIDRLTDPAELDAIERRLQLVLRDVREVVEDWRKMHTQADHVVADLADNPPPLPDVEVNGARELLAWLADDHFTFLGYREYQLQCIEGEDMLRAVPGTGLGILRSDQDMSPTFGKLPPTVRAKAREKELLIITKANSRSTVHRPAYLDYIGLKCFDANGDVCGERRFLGLFSSAAYTESVTRIPVLRDKAAELIARSGYSPLSHSGKALMDIMETYPRDELFQTSVEELLPIAESVLHLQERRQLRFFVRRDTYGRFLSCLVYLPRERYTTQVREKMQQILAEVLGADTIDHTARVSESVLARLHFVVRAAPGETLRDFDEEALEERLADAARSWTDDLAVALGAQFGEEEAARLGRRYGDAFPEAYKEDFRPIVAARDVHRLEAIGDGPIGIALYSPVDAADNEARFKVFRQGTPLSLSDVLPMLSAMGVEVVDERPYEIDCGQQKSWIYDFGLRRRTALPEGSRSLFQDAFMAVWEGRAESDGFSALVLEAGLSWRQVSILRAYAKYFRQAGTPFSQEYIEASLQANVQTARLLVTLFETRFNPAGGGDADDVEKQIETALDRVASLDQDRILRGYLLAIKATLRTNFYQPAADGGPKSYLSLKLEPREMPDLPEPRPAFEVFVYSPRVEGVHLRFGPVARGGLRWSDRREDFRTEVLGLVKAQMVKNAVIVPVGAKGGFYCKQSPDPAVDRDAWLAEGIACYKTFISGLLDITDNLVAGQTVPPPQVVRHDGDDSYLVVAADKGTATFSDIANGVAKDYGFWLGDAFASGGSVGYDHKAMGITARGAWESVRRHFRERGIDCQAQDFTCVGIGDMSGDVFGNGMLLSEHIRLVAAFDHRDIFLDPEPDSASSFAERRRLFDLPRSSWADYDTSLISAGGGVYPRSLKSIAISPEVAKTLHLKANVTSMTPVELMRAILVAPVDLLWNGGIGTYVKAAVETNADVGDKANDAIRVNGGDLRSRAVGEGGNLGFTQRGRIEYAQSGGRINTDAIDNSAGVDTSDHEVNIKILLDRVMDSGDMTEKQRNALLASMTDEVGTLVLADNYGQNLAIASAEAVAKPLMHVHASWIRRLERQGYLDREIEFLPSSKEIDARMANGIGMTAPELSVLLAYTKIVLARELVDTELPDDEFLRGELVSYFPSLMRSTYLDQMEKHPLRREIIVTQVVNDMVNFAGITFFHRLSQETNATADELTHAHIVCRRIYNADALVDQINELDNKISAAVQTDMRLSVRTLIERATRWIVNNRRSPLDAASTVEFFQDELARVVEALPKLVRGGAAKEFADRHVELTGAGVPDELATAIAVLPAAYAALEVVEIAKRDNIDSIEVADVHHVLEDRARLFGMFVKIFDLPRGDRWQTMARASLRDDLQAVHADLTSQILATTDRSKSAEDRVKGWEKSDKVVVGRAVATIKEILSDEHTDLARLSVGLRVVRSMLVSPYGPAAMDNDDE